MKLFLKTLLHSVKYAAAFLFMYFIGNYLTRAFLNTYFKDNDFVGLLLVTGVPIVSVFIFATANRMKNEDLADAYKKVLSDSKFCLWKDTSETVKSKDFVNELLILLLYELVVVLIGWRIIFSVSIMDGILTILIPIILFLILNLISIELTHLKIYKSMKRSKGE